MFALAAERNSMPLPVLGRTNLSVQLPADRFALMQPNYVVEHPSAPAPASASGVAATATAAATAATVAP
jgi:hypothetical protein